MGQGFVYPPHKHRYMASSHSNRGRRISLEGNTGEFDAGCTAKPLKGKPGTGRDPGGCKFNFSWLFLGVSDKLFNRLAGSLSVDRNDFSIHKNLTKENKINIHKDVSY